MILALPHDLYNGVESILIYPSTVVTSERPVGVFEVTQGPVRRAIPILGEAQSQ